jgi:hypothetical protein
MEINPKPHVAAATVFNYLIIHSAILFSVLLKRMCMKKTIPV